MKENNINLAKHYKKKPKYEQTNCKSVNAFTSPHEWVGISTFIKNFKNKQKILLNVRARVVLRRQTLTRTAHEKK